MSTNTTVPATLVGVWPGAQVIHTDGRVGIVVATGELAGQPCAWAAFGAGINSVPEPACHSVQALALDLTHRMTRLEVIERWRRVTPRTTGGISEPWFGRMHRPNVRYLACGDLHAVAHPVGRPSYLTYAVVVPALANLDPTDDTLLPDGARLVDVQALALVVAHVFGGPA